MLFPSDTHQPPSPPPPPPAHNPSSDTPHSDSGRSFSSSSSSGEIMGTPFDLGAQRFEYPFPQSQGSPTDAFLPLSSAITPHSHSHAQLPSWPIHISKSFPLTPPPLGKFKAHPKLRAVNAREPPVPPALVKRKSRIAGVKHQSSSEEPGDLGDNVARTRRPSRFLFLETPARKPSQSDPSLVPVKQVASFPIGSFVRPSIEDTPTLAVNGATSADRPPRLPVLQRERIPNRVRDQIHLFTLYCWIVASQLSRWFFRFLGWLSRA